MIASLGVFDGVHIGHQRILSTLKDLSEKLGLPSVVFVISHPPEYSSPDFPGLLMPLEKRKEMISSFAHPVVLDFSSIRDLSAEDFVERFLKDVKIVVVGRDFKFGRGGRGDVRLLEAKEKYVVLVDDVVVDGMRVSSSLVRRLVQTGRVEEARRYLGRPFELFGKVYRDRQYGRVLGFPTANLDRGNEKLVNLKSGVYFVRVTLPNGEGKFGVMNVGYRPTVLETRDVKYEVHVLEFEGDLYGKELKVEVLRYLREERKFGSVEELKEAISRDVETAKEISKDFLI